MMKKVVPKSQTSKLVGPVFLDKTITSPVQESNWITRGLFGATFATGYAPNKPYLSSIVFNAAYQVRLLSAPEVNYPKTGKKITPPRE